MKMSRHAQRRSQQRGIRPKAVEATLAWGQVIVQRNGRVAFYLGRRQVDQARRQGVDVRAHRRTAVIQSSDGTIVTVVRTNRPNRLRAWRKRTR